jgi:hypothetical protein
MQNGFMPAVGSKPLVPWKRFWCQLGKQVHVGNEEPGFLTDPEGQFTRFYNPHLRPLDGLLDEACLILCGDPGSGKTTELERTKARFEESLQTGDHMISLEFRDIPNEAVFARRTFDSPIWREWRNSSGRMTLLVDGVDEGLIKIPDFLSYLVGQLRDEPLQRLQLVLACRSAEWPVSSGEALIALWGAKKTAPIFELCPLRQQDARLAAKVWHLDAAAFLQAVYERKAVGLAALPTTLFFLLGQFRSKGALSNTHRELYEQGCQTLAREHDPRKVEALRSLRRSARVFTPEEIYLAANRIAALLLVCGKSAIRTLASADCATDSEDADLSLSDAMDSSGLSSVTNFSVSEDLLLDAIGTGLFTSRGSNRFSFAHQTFAECLTAQYLSRLPFIQIRRLICARDEQDEHAIPQLAETAAWLAGMRDDFFEHLLRVDPEVMLRSDISKVQNQQKAQLVEAVLEKAKRAEVFDGWNSHRFYSALNHPGLAGQLRTYISDTTLNVVVRRMALKIAGQCQLSELTDVMLAILANHNDIQQIRDGAASSLEHVIPDAQLTMLIPLAKGETGPDPDDTIKGCALRRLVPDFWSVSQVLPLLTTPKRHNFFGSYQHFLEYQLPDYLMEADLQTFLVLMIRRKDCFDSLSRFHKLADRAFTMALQRLGDPVIRRSAVRVWLVKERRYQPLPRDKESEVIQLLDTKEEIRLAFVEAIINDPKTKEKDVWCLQGVSGYLILPRDLSWALHKIVGAPQVRRTSWAEAIAILARPDATLPCWDLFLERVETVPELKEKFAWLRAWTLDEPETRNAKARWLREQRRHDRFAKSHEGPDPEILLQADFADIAAGKTYRWIDLCLHLSVKQGQSHYLTPLQHDIMEFPGWERADDARRSQIVDAARQFLIHHGDGYAELGTRTTYSDPGYLAAWLLRDRIKDDAVLRGAIASKWIDGLIGYPFDSDEHYQNTAMLAYKLNPEATLRAFEREVKEEDERHGRVLSLHGFEKAWDARFSRAALELAANDSLKPDSIGSILQFVGYRDPTVAALNARALLTPNAVTSTALRERTIKVLAACLNTMPAEMWDTMMPILSADSSMAEQIILEVAHEHHHEIGRIHEMLSEEQLADLYLLVRNLFRPETDPTFEGGFVPPRQSVVDFRGSLLNALESRGTTAACGQFLRLANALPSESLWLRLRYRNTVTFKRRKSWTPPTPQMVLELAARVERRLVDNEYDLVEVIIESLNRLQDVLTQTTLPRAEDLWSWDGADSVRRNFRPKDEVALSDYIASWLGRDLGGSGVVVGREVQPRRGQKTDIYVAANPGSDSLPAALPITVVIEVKGCWHAQVRTAIEEQLVNRYLKDNALMYGIYLVGWFVCEQWQDSHLRATTCDEARKEMEQLAAKFDGKSSPYLVQSVVLDCRYLQ